MRASGILMPVFSLPGPFGIGTLGSEATAFVDFLAEAKQTYWQILPIGPTGYGDSPYQSFSAFAGNPYFIDFRLLAADGYLTAEEIPAAQPVSTVDYGALYNQRPVLLKKAADRLLAAPSPAYEAFCTAQSFWLEDYALFMAVKAEQGQAGLADWPDALRCREPEVIAAAKVRLADQISYHKAVQFFFYTQWNALKAYANRKGVLLVGDIPIYVSADSVDAWVGGKLFELDADGRFARVAGCPPDYFSADGQLWGNPLYNWKKHTETGYAWWIERIKYQLTVTDFLRIDHFRGFDRYWAVPYGEETAINGEWKPAPGLNFFTQLEANLGYHLPIIAEDLGEIDDSVIELRDKFGLPGMKILQFAFENPNENDFLPHNYTPNCVCYTGTHDNDTTLGWYTQAYEASKDKLRRYYSTDASDICWVMIRACFSSVANMAIVPMQDVLKLDSWARMNTPGVGEGNWAWRFKASDLSKQLSDRLLETSKLYGRYTPIPEKKDSEEK